MRSVAASAGAVHVNSSSLDESDPANVRFDYSRTLGEAQSLCAGELFADQIEPGFCSGTLIDEQHILTAGHCVDSRDSCDGSTAWVLGFRLSPDGSVAPLDEDDVYRCTQVLAYRQDNADHAVVRLDRPVRGHTPAPVRVLAAGLPLGTPLTLIGHPNGIPMKIASGGTVTESAPSGEDLLATLDAFSGNSGSGVFNDAGELVALLDGGERDYIRNGRCNIVNVIEPVPDDDGESLTYVSPAIEAFCLTPGVDSSLCACDGPCVEVPPGDTCEAAQSLSSVSQVLTGNLSGFTAGEEGSCAGAGVERVWQFTVDEAVDFRAESAGFDSVLYLRDSCDGPDLACHDDIDTDTNRGSEIETSLAPGDYFLFLDSYDSDVADYTLTLEFTAQSSGGDAGPDAGADTGVGDAGPDDAGLDDAGPDDAGMDDARVSDAGDAGADANMSDGADDASGGGDASGCAASGRGASPTWMLIALCLVGLGRRRR